MLQETGILNGQSISILSIRFIFAARERAVASPKLGSDIISGN